MSYSAQALAPQPVCLRLHHLQCFAFSSFCTLYSFIGNAQNPEMMKCTAFVQSVCVYVEYFSLEQSSFVWRWNEMSFIWIFIQMRCTCMGAWVYWGRGGGFYSTTMHIYPSIYILYFLKIKYLFVFICFPMMASQHDLKILRYNYHLTIVCKMITCYWFLNHVFPVN